MSPYLNRNRLSPLEQQMLGALQEAREYFDQRADVNWEGDGPNAEMSLLTEIDQALAAADRAASSSTEE